MLPTLLIYWEEEPFLQDLMGIKVHLSKEKHNSKNVCRNSAFIDQNVTIQHQI